MLFCVLFCMLLCVLLHAALCCPVCCYAVVCKLVVCLYVVLGFLPELSYSINVTAMVWVHFVDCFPLLLGYISVYVISLRYFHMTRLIHYWFKYNILFEIYCSVLNIWINFCLIFFCEYLFIFIFRSSKFGEPLIYFMCHDRN